MIASLTAYNENSFNGALHCHDNAHVSFALDGGSVEKKKDPYEIAPGAIIYYSAGEEHQVLKVVRTTRRINLELEQSFFEQFQISDGMLRSLIQKNPDARFLMVKMYKEILTADEYSLTSIQMLLLQLIRKTEKLAAESKWPAWVHIVRNLLSDHPYNKLSLHDLSIAANVHPVTISKHFPKYFGCTLGEYARKLKIVRALSMIKSSKLSLTEIALECGFFDQNHFIRTFKEFSGCLPRQYKKG